MFFFFLFFFNNYVERRPKEKKKAGLIVGQTKPFLVVDVTGVTVPDCVRQICSHTMTTTTAPDKCISVYLNTTNRPGTISRVYSVTPKHKRIIFFSISICL